MSEPFQQILGIRFYVGDLQGLLERAAQGGLIVVPSGPGLAELDTHHAYREALEGATFAITDSGYLVLLWMLFRWQKLQRISGLGFMRGLVTRPEFRAPGASFWVMPTPEDAQANLDWLRSESIEVPPENTYLAPRYGTGALSDPELVARIERARPRYVVLCIGGGVQERLGHFLHTNLAYRPAIICTGAAIAFLSGQQVAIPVWADRLMLGWLFRICSAPSRYWPRYRAAIRLAPIVLRHGARPVKPRVT
jgi:UDP-N-acetyl-D-mannosaminuronic acid transferase (WecB/TagA/CpsF family)